LVKIVNNQRSLIAGNAWLPGARIDVLARGIARNWDTSRVHGSPASAWGAGQHLSIQRRSQQRRCRGGNWSHLDGSN